MSDLLTNGVRPEIRVPGSLRVIRAFRQPSRINDRVLNRDLEALCAKVTKARPRLPDGHPSSFVYKGLLSFHF